MSKISLLVVSCDRYSDLWKPFFTIFWRNWPDCPFPVYLGSNYQSFHHPQVTVLQIGEDFSWSGGIKEMLKRIPTPYVLLFLEDFFLLEPVDTACVLSSFETLQKLNGDMLRLKPDPPPDHLLESFPGIGQIDLDTMFRVSTQTAIWRREFLLNLLQEKESAWEFEVKGSERSREMSNGFYGTREPIFQYSHVIERGKWFRWSAKHFGEMELGCDFRRRPVMTLTDSLKWNYMRINGKLRMKLLQGLSWEQRHQIRQLKTRFFNLNKT